MGQYIESELRRNIRELEAENNGLRKAGQTLCNRVSDVLDGINDEWALREAVRGWGRQIGIM